MRVVIQSDGTLSPHAVHEINTHLPGAEVLDRDSSIEIIRQRAGEGLLRELPELNHCQFFLLLKLLNVIFVLPRTKIILFDSDLVFLRSPPFVREWIDGIQKGCFHSDGGSHLASVFRTIGFNFSKVDVSEFNAGFIGFHNDVTSARLTDIVIRIREFNPELLDNWEIEQAIWSVLFNDFADPVNLDDIEEDYVASGYWPYERIQRSVLAHFVGSIRFKNFRYIRLARQVVGELKSQSVLQPPPRITEIPEPITDNRAV
ncbi:MAG: hypothetical protein ACKVT0_08485 [Planctomycetaceae bacterium]